MATDLLRGDAQQPSQQRDAVCGRGSLVKGSAIEIKYGEPFIEQRAAPGIIGIILPQRIVIVKACVGLIKYGEILI